MVVLIVAIAILIIVNVIAFTMFVSDKNKAKKGKHRMSEKALLIVSLVGPFGAVIGMKVARHKTRKAKFWLVYVFVMIHIALIAYLLWRYDIISF